MRFFASEFPNDNGALHVGTIWMSEEPCGPLEAQPPELTPPSPMAQFSDDEDGADIEIVESLGPVEAVDEGPRAALDPYAQLVVTLAAVARDGGAPELALRLADTLDIDPVASAWRAILRGESDDYAACGPATLDEWASDTLARLMSAPSRASQLRRELRSRGVVAFGLVQAA